jgi:hypothetical protein
MKKTFTYEQAESALCIWEEILSIHMDEKNTLHAPVEAAFDDMGAGQMRSFCLEMAIMAERVWNSLPDRTDWEVVGCYDWDFIPCFMHYVQWDSLTAAAFSPSKERIKYTMAPRKIAKEILAKYGA